MSRVTLGHVLEALLIDFFFFFFLEEEDASACYKFVWKKQTTHRSPLFSIDKGIFAFLRYKGGFHLECYLRILRGRQKVSVTTSEDHLDSQETTLTFALPSMYI